MRIFSRIEINHFVLNLSRIIWFILPHRKLKLKKKLVKTQRCYWNAHFMLWPNQSKKIHQIKAWYNRIDLTNSLRSYNGLSFISFVTYKESILRVSTTQCQIGLLFLPLHYFTASGMAWVSKNPFFFYK